jgi:hypothetical protein
MSEEEPNRLELAGITAQDQETGEVPEQVGMHPQAGDLTNCTRDLLAHALPVLVTVAAREKPGPGLVHQSRAEAFPIKIE